MRSLLMALFGFVLLGCQREDSGLSNHTSDTFYVENKGSSMRVLVEGNTSSKVFIIFIHGGPGASAYVYNTNFMSETLENKYAVVYWDQRNSGGSQGNSNGGNLNFSQILDDFGKVIRVINFRYGDDIEFFLMSHSFGGLIASGFLTEGTNQDLFKGFINVDGSHNYPLNDTLTREKLLTTGIMEISLNHHVEEWKKITEFCSSHRGNFTLDESRKLEKFASQAEGYIDSVRKVKFFPLVTESMVSDKYPITSMLVNLLYSLNSSLNKEISVKEFSSSLKKISIPVLILFGKYDFICPPELGYDFYTRIGSQHKRIVISPISGHNLMFQDKELLSHEVTAFIEEFR